MTKAVLSARYEHYSAYCDPLHLTLQRRYKKTTRGWKEIFQKQLQPFWKRSGQTSTTAKQSFCNINYSMKNCIAKKMSFSYIIYPQLVSGIIPNRRSGEVEKS